MNYNQVISHGLLSTILLAHFMLTVDGDIEREVTPALRMFLHYLV
ncbi:hypothetical protein GYH30_017852 [Glycine max]|nr:hypothetical protein GYH30_017852 [Glycine max]